MSVGTGTPGQASPIEIRSNAASGWRRASLPVNVSPNAGQIDELVDPVKHVIARGVPLDDPIKERLLHRFRSPAIGQISPRQK
jgi:hypothetical protein